MIKSECAEQRALKQRKVLASATLNIAKSDGLERVESAGYSRGDATAVEDLDPEYNATLQRVREL